ncbi:MULTISPECIES: alpha/beta fold hydrolase [Microbacterium]|uniref:alpha/beta fold hydrolase n=1 Tax=Microbacterium TaxID=33882 RepID=UPI001484C812|nr:alpha/beta fold hydrolase [Microbacterium sp. 4NA327F11]MCK9917439.1 alpha/beta hydrolase [Microbacteriaceae bacterium K1510]
MSDRAGVVTTADGADLAWRQTGAGTRELLLIAGQGVSVTSWDPVLPALTAVGRVTVYDHRGIGGSTVGEATEWSTRSLARDAATVIEALDIAPAAVIGHSMGGRVAQWLAIDRPELVDRLVLVSTTGGDARGMRREDAATSALANGTGDVLAPYFFSDAYIADNPHAISLFTRRDAAIPVRRGHFQASSTHDAWDELARITAPTLVVHGADDRITPPENGRRVAASVPGATLVEVPGARHAPQLDTEAALTAIVDFVRG